jgi:molecular chaperone GrpE
MTKKTTNRSDSKGVKTTAKKTSVEEESKTTTTESKVSQEEKQSEDQKNDMDVKVAELDNEIEELKEQLADAEENSKIWHDKYLRLSAEFDNYRKRTLKEKTDLTKLANAELLKAVLPVVDDFERGLSHLDNAEDKDSLKQGVELIYNKFVEFLRQNSVNEIDAVEKDFDIDFHEAMTKIPAPTKELKGKVVDVLEKGYMLNDRVLRYAKVVVGE